MESISNKIIVNFISEKTNNDLKKKIICVFPSNYTNSFINFHDILMHSEGKY